MSTTTRALPAALRLPSQPDLPVTVLVRHEAQRPDLVRAVVLLEDDSFELPLDRTLLTEGLIGASAHGDVQVQTVGDQVLVGVGELTVVLPRVAVTELLLASYAAAPTGAAIDLVIALERNSLVVGG